MTPRHVVIIGAARSGTKMLRSALATAAGVGAVPYDIGYVWRLHNERAADDVLSPADLDDGARRFIRRFVDRYAAGELPTVIEKTVGNTMRVPFVAAVLPDARYVHLVRDGIDVAESSRRQWTAPPDRRYLAAKLRHVPQRVVVRHGASYAASLAARAFTKDRRVSSWGPRYLGIDADLSVESLLTVCARQWRESVLTAQRDLSALTVPVIEVRYEAFVQNPVDALTEVLDFLALPPAHKGPERAAGAIAAARIGVGRTALTPAELRSIELEVAPTLEELGYLPARAGFDVHRSDVIT